MTTTTVSPARKRVKIESLGYGSGSLYQRVRDGRFEHEYVDPATRKQHRVTLAATTRSAARKEAQERVGKVARGEVAAPTTMTFDDVALEYLALVDSLVASGERSARTSEIYWQRYKTHLRPRLGRLRIQQIHARHLSELLAHLRARGLSPNTRTGIFMQAGAILEHAVVRGYINANPKNRIARSERPKAKNVTRARVLTAEEVAALVDHAPKRYRCVIDTARWTGMRLSELLGLRWCDVDLDAATIAVRNQLSRAKVGEPARLVPLKTDGSQRTIPMSPELGRALLTHKLQSGFSADDDFVFCTTEGTPLYYRNVVERGLKKAADRAGLNPDGAQRLSMHDLRHTAITHLIRAGADVGQVARFAGHTRPSMTLDRYTHEFTAHRGSDVAELLSASMGAGA